MQLSKVGRASPAAFDNSNVVEKQILLEIKSEFPCNYFFPPVGGHPLVKRCAKVGGGVLLEQYPIDLTSVQIPVVGVCTARVNCTGDMEALLEGARLDFRNVPGHPDRHLKYLIYLIFSEKGAHFGDHIH